MSTDIHTTSPTISENAAESTFHEVDDRHRAIPAIEFRNVVLAFDDRVILDNLSFKVMKGETKIILGGSGGGKSTIIKTRSWLTQTRRRDRCWSTAKTLPTTPKTR